MNRPLDTALLDTLINAAHASGRVLMRRFQTRLRVSLKEDLGLLTDADIESEKACMKVLRKAFPEFGIISEETPGDLNKQWSANAGNFIMDPLDGTSNYAHGLSIFCVTLAARWMNETVVGVTLHPVTGDLYTAIRGKGAFFNGKKIHVSKTRNLKDAFLSTGFCSRKVQSLKVELAAFERLSRASGAVRRPGSAALDLAHVARGVFDGFWEQGLGPWDLAAGTLLIEEAGGKVTDYTGKPIDIFSGRVLASNEYLHDAIRKTAQFKI